MNKITRKITLVISAAVISISACMSVYAGKNDPTRYDSYIELDSNSRWTGEGRPYKYDHFAIKYRPQKVCTAVGGRKNSFSVQAGRSGFFNGSHTGFKTVKYSSKGKWSSQELGYVSASKVAYEFKVDRSEFGPSGDVIMWCHK